MPLYTKAMKEKVEIFLVDEEGILIRVHIAEENYDYDGDPEALESPLMLALGKYYRTKAPKTLLSRGFKTPSGSLYWYSEVATPFGDDDHIEVGERLYLMDDYFRRFSDEFAYISLSEGITPLGWTPLEDGEDEEDSPGFDSIPSTI